MNVVAIELSLALFFLPAAGQCQQLTPTERDELWRKHVVEDVKTIEAIATAGHCGLVDPKITSAGEIWYELAAGLATLHYKQTDNMQQVRDMVADSKAVGDLRATAAACASLSAKPGFATKMAADLSALLRTDPTP